MLSEIVAEAIQEAYAAHYVLANMGYEPEEISVSVHEVSNATPPGRYSVITLKRGNNRFTFHQVPLNSEEESDFKLSWLHFIANKKDKTQEELDRLVHSSRTWDQKVALLMALELKGFKLEPGKMHN